jgi:hypothetical protein
MVTQLLWLSTARSQRCLQLWQLGSGPSQSERGTHCGRTLALVFTEKRMSATLLKHSPHQEGWAAAIGDN